MGVPCPSAPHAGRCGSLLVAVVASLGISAGALAHGRGHGHRHHGPAAARPGTTGFVTSNDGSRLTVRDGRARPHSYTLTSSTTYVFGDGTAATASDASPGSVVAVRTTTPATTGAHPTATRVVIHLSRIAGLVAGNDAGTLPVYDREGFTRTMTTSATTTCRQDGATVACSAIAPNAVLVARGRASGATLSATRVDARTGS